MSENGKNWNEEVLEELAYLGRRMGAVLDRLQAAAERDAAVSEALVDLRLAARNDLSRASSERFYLDAFRASSLWTRLKWAFGVGTPPVIVSFADGAYGAFTPYHGSKVYRPTSNPDRSFAIDGERARRVRSEFERRLRAS